MKKGNKTDVKLISKKYHKNFTHITKNILTNETHDVIFTHKEGSGSMYIDYELIGRRIKEARRKKGWSQEKLSEEIDVAVAYLSRIETGTAQINLKRLIQISQALEEPIEKLISGTIPTEENYLDKDLYDILIKCTPAKQKLIYNIAKIVSGSNFV